MKNTIILFGFLVFLIYIYYNPKKTRENFIGSNKGVDAIQNIFKKNFDLEYYDTRDPKKMSELKKMFTNKLAPLIQKEMKNNPGKVRALVKKFTSRIPDKKSTENEYVIPMPKFDNLKGDLLKPLIKSFKQIHNLKAQKKVNYKPIINADNIVTNKKSIVSMKKKESKKELFNNNNNKITERQIPQNLNCKFVTSFKSTNKCPSNYPIYTGATVSGLGSNLSCNGNNINAKRASAIAIIKNGSIKNVKIIDSGMHYSKVPRVFFRGLGKGARAVAKINNGKVISINLINGGKGYNSTPTIIIEKPQINIHCNLCCKK